MTADDKPGSPASLRQKLAHTISSARIDKRDLKDTQNIGRDYGLPTRSAPTTPPAPGSFWTNDAVVTSVEDC